MSMWVLLLTITWNSIWGCSVLVKCLMSNLGTLTQSQGDYIDLKNVQTSEKHWNSGCCWKIYPCLTSARICYLQDSQCSWFALCYQRSSEHSTNMKVNANYFFYWLDVSFELLSGLILPDVQFKVSWWHYFRCKIGIIVCITGRHCQRYCLRRYY